jgi:predicted DCC family thiol-disulfide oxidoreductase YuxK
LKEKLLEATSVVNAMKKQNAAENLFESKATDTSAVLLYDGVCGLCNKSVQTVLNHDKRGTMRFAALQSDYGQKATARHPELKGVDSLVLLEASAATGEEKAYTRSTAALKIASYLGGVWKLFLIARLIPRPVRDALYNLVARYRYRVFGKHDTCMLPPPSARARFLDAA